MITEYILIAFTENNIGVLNRITASYLRRNINIESLKVSESAIKGISMFVITAYCLPEVMDKVARQIRNIVDVIDVHYYAADQLITQEIALYKVSTEVLNGSNRLDNFTTQWGARMIEMTRDYIVVEKTGAREDIEAMRDVLADMGVLLDFTRSGSVVLHGQSIAEMMEGRLG